MGSRLLLYVEVVDLRLQVLHLNRKLFPGARAYLNRLSGRFRRSDFHKGGRYYYRRGFLQDSNYRI